MSLYRRRSFFLDGALPAGLLACLALAALLYFPSLRAPFLFDDHSNIVNNPDIRRLENLKTRLVYPYDKIVPNRNYPARPLTFLTFTLNYHWGGLDTHGYRLFNLAAHLAAAALAFLLARRLWRLALGDDGGWAPLVAALLFAVHPIQTEVAAYVSNRSDSLSALFLMGAMLLFLGALERQEFGRRVRLALSAACFALSLASKETGVVLPLLALAADFLFVSGLDRRKVMRNVPAHAVLWAVAAAFLLLRKLYFGRIGFLGEDVLSVWNPLSYLLAQLSVVLRYIGLLILPVGQSIDHYVWPLLSPLEPRVWIAGAAWLGGVFLFWRLTRDRRERIAANPASISGREKLALFAGVWFAATLVPTSSVFPAYDAMVERRLYLPSFGFFLAVAAAVRGLAGSEDSEPARARRRLMAGALAAYAAVLCAFTWKRTELYRDPARIWQDALKKYPQNDRAYSNLGTVHFQRGELDRAEENFRKITQLPYAPRDAAYTNIGNVYYERRDFERALEYFLKAVKENPRLHIAYRNMGDALYELDRFDAAEVAYRKAIGLEPENAEVHNNLGVLQFERKNYPAAELQFRKAAELDSAYAEPLLNLADLALERNRLEEALSFFEEAARRDPRSDTFAKIEELRGLLVRLSAQPAR